MRKYRVEAISKNGVRSHVVVDAISTDAAILTVQEMGFMAGRASLEKLPDSNVSLGSLPSRQTKKRFPTYWLWLCVALVTFVLMLWGLYDMTIGREDRAAATMRKAVDAANETLDRDSEKIKLEMELEQIIDPQARREQRGLTEKLTAANIEVVIADQNVVTAARELDRRAGRENEERLRIAKERASAARATVVELKEKLEESERIYNEKRSDLQKRIDALKAK